MTIRIELSPEEERVLSEQAHLSGRDLAEYVQGIIRGHVSRSNEPPLELEDLIDYDLIASCAREADDGVTLEEVLEATSSIKDSMARVIIEEERADRV